MSSPEKLNGNSPTPEVNGGEDYQDFEPDTLGELKEIKRTPGMCKVAPKIRWGEDYKSWPIERRLDYAEKLASAMNHAADVLQQEKFYMAGRMTAMERQLEQAKVGYTQQGDLMHSELGKENAEKQELYKQIRDLTKELKLAKRRIALLEKEKEGGD